MKPSMANAFEGLFLVCKQDCGSSSKRVVIKPARKGTDRLSCRTKEVVDELLT